MTDLGKRIQELRKQQKLSQTELANRVGVSKSQINRYENIGVQPPADILNKLAEVFSTSIVFLINGNTGDKAKATLKSSELLQRFKEVEALPEREQTVLLEIIGAYIRDFRTKQAYIH